VRISCAPWDKQWVKDGTEIGLILAGISNDTNTGVFQPDMDPLTTTNPLKLDTDGDGVSDGVEDTNHNGKIDPGETDPNPRRAMPWIPLLLLG
jgi:hypothetical protein